MFIESMSPLDLQRRRGIKGRPYYGNAEATSSGPALGGGAGVRRLIVADPSLQSASGHHQQLLRKIQSGADAFGLELVALCHEDYVPPVELETRTRGIFSTDIYQYYKRPKTEWTVDDSRGWAMFVQPILELFSREPELASDSVILFHTAEAFLFASLAHGLGALPDTFPFTVLVTPYTPESMPNRHFVTPVVDSMRVLAASARFAVLGEIRELSLDYYDSGVLCDFLELPFWPDARRAEKGDNESVRIVSLGTARDEKGFQYLPEIIRLVQSHCIPGTVKFVVQITPQRIGYTQTVERAVKVLRSMASEDLELIEEALTDEEYIERLKSAHGILCPYERAFYRARGSGLAVDAINFKCVPFGTSGTLPGEFSRLAGYDGLERAEDFAEAILDFAGAAGDLDTRLDSVLNQLASSSSPTAYIQKLLRIVDFKQSERRLRDLLMKQPGRTFVSA
jgi:hypothetical protein